MRSVAVLGVPMDLGAGRRGVDMGPSAIRYARLHEELTALGYRVIELGDLEVPVAESLVPEPPPHHAGAIAAVCRRLYERLLALDDAVVDVEFRDAALLSAADALARRRLDRVRAALVIETGKREFRIEGDLMNAGEICTAQTIPLYPC